MEAKELATITEEDVFKYVAGFIKLHESAKDHFETFHKSEFNRDGKDTPSKTIFELAMKATQRAFSWCEDEEDSDVILTDRGGRPLCPITMAVWRTTYHAQHGSRDALTGLAMDFEKVSHYMPPTLLAHKNHGRPFFPEHLLKTKLGDLKIDDILSSNATVQMWGTNKWIRAKRGSHIVQSVVDAREGSIKFLRRLRTVGILRITDGELDDFAQLKNVIPTSAQFVKCNRLLIGETPKQT